MAEIRWSAESEKWLKDIHDYIAQDNHEAATRVVKGIYEKAQILINFPEIGYQYKTENEGEIRILLYGHYRITYLWNKKDNFIDILGVFHGALNIEKYIL